MTVAQRVQQGGLLQDPATRHVHNGGALWQGPESLAPEELPGLRGERTVDRQDVARCEELLEGKITGFEFVLHLRRQWVALMIHDLHPESNRPTRHGATDSAHAEDAEPLARQLMAPELHDVFLPPTTRAHEPISFGYAA